MKTKIEVIGLPAAGKTTFFRNNKEFASVFKNGPVPDLTIWQKLNLRFTLATSITIFLLERQNL